MPVKYTVRSRPAGFVVEGTDGSSHYDPSTGKAFTSRAAAKALCDRLNGRH